MPWATSTPSPTTVAASAGFSAICGSNSATTATMGTIAMPEMRRYGYDPALSTGAIAVGGTLGVVIPPSVVLIVIAVQTETNGDLLVTLAVAQANSVAVAQLAATNQLLLVGQSIDGSA